MDPSVRTLKPSLHRTQPYSCSGAVRVVCGRTSILTCGLLGLADAKHHWGIHREAPPFVEQSTAQEILVTGIKARPAPSSYSRMLNSSFGACNWRNQSPPDCRRLSRREDLQHTCDTD